MKKLLSIALISMMLTFSACTQSTTDPQTDDENTNQNVSETPESENDAKTDSYYPITITTYDYEGNEVEITFEEAPNKTIAIYQGCIETMIALGLEEHVVASYGLDNAVKPEWEDGLSKMNYDASVFAPDLETVTMLDPDLIFSWGSIFSDDMLGDVDTWHEKGVNTYMNTNTRRGQSRTLENEYTDILNIGKIFNVNEEAEALVNQMKDEISQVQEATEGQKSQTVLVLSPYDDYISNRGDQELVGDMIASLGGTVAHTESGKIEKEIIVGANPDVIFLSYMPRPDDIDGATVLEEVISAIVDDPAFASLDAVKNERIYPIMLGDMYASAPRTLDGIKTIAQGLYPDLTME